MLFGSLSLLFVAIVHLKYAEASLNLDKESVDYLKQFGYVPEDRRFQTMTEVRAAIKTFQKIAHIPVTGTIDNATKEAMKWPRCGNIDSVHMNEIRKRYILHGSFWGDKHSLTYRISQYTPDLNKSEVDATIQKAFDKWAAVTPLEFTPAPTGDVDIEIVFAGGSHGDGYPFDGPSGVLAHAFYPHWGGDTHFDEAETWALNNVDGFNLLEVATHEFGHALGLAHSEVENAVMAPFYSGLDPDFDLHSDDVAGIQNIYGPNFCHLPVDAALFEDNQQYFFSGDHFVLLNDGGNDIVVGYPRKIDYRWYDLPGNLDAAMHWDSTGETYFFKGDDVWIYKGRTKVGDEHPVPISSRFKGLPSNIDAALVWSNDRVYVFKGGSYYKLNSERNAVVHKMPISYWPGLPASIDAAVRWSNGRSYMFKGNKYYRYNDINNKVDSQYPMNTAALWFGCSSKKKRALPDQSVNGRENVTGARHPMGEDALNVVNTRERNKSIPWKPIVH